MAITKPPVLPAWAESGDKVTPSNAEIQVGWPLSSIPPSRQRFNWLLNFLANGIRYFSRRGLPDYDAAETYMTGDRIIGDDGKTYCSLIDNNTAQTPSTSPTKWERWALTLAEIETSLTTPAQFDNSTKLATTAFAWQQGLHFQNGAGIALTANTTLTASQAGHWLESRASNLTITLPPLASFPSGMATYTFRAPLALTLKANGSELIQSASGVAANTLSVASGECVTVVGNGAGGQWYVVLGGFGSASFSKSFGTSGYQKLPSGLIIQWGSGLTAADGSIAVTFPIAFPTACVGIHGTHSGSGMAAMIEVLGTRSTTGVITKTINHLGGVAAGWPGHWLAIGY